MKITPLKIDGAWIIELNRFEDGRGFFYESFRSEVFKNFFGSESRIKQSTTSLGMKKSIIFFRYTLSHPSPVFINNWYPKLRLNWQDV